MLALQPLAANEFASIRVILQRMRENGSKWQYIDYRIRLKFNSLMRKLQEPYRIVNNSNSHYDKENEFYLLAKMF